MKDIFNSSKSRKMILEMLTLGPKSSKECYTYHPGIAAAAFVFGVVVVDDVVVVV